MFELPSGGSDMKDFKLEEETRLFNQYHTAQYQGYQPGHDNALRSDSNQPSSYAASPVASQYGSGFQSQQRFQPTGYVQSFYGQQQQNQSFQQRPQQMQFQQAGIGAASFGQTGGQQSYHLANYRGNQANHDQSLRADSQQPSQIGFASQQPSQIGFVSQQPQQMGMGTNPQSYHAANYRGNQPNHDNYLRSDSQQPSSFGMAGAFGAGQSQQFNAGFQGTQQYHAANYRGNQPNHDNYLRADSQQPSQMNAISNMRNFSSQSFIR